MNWIWFALALHVATVAVVATLAGRRSTVVFAVAAIPVGATSIWSATQLAAGDPVTASIGWVGGLDLTFAFRVDQLSALLGLVVCGVATLVFVYSSGYFGTGNRTTARFASTILAFSTAMLGLVWADSIWTLFVFWELTSITSFLLVGYKNEDPVARNAARRALVITAAGGLVLLAGLLLLADTSGTTALRDLEPATGASANLGAILVLVAAATKSAQVPFHLWLPGAMAAPTPVSAFLHSATMVKAGVILVAILLPALGGTPVWTPLGMTFGIASMVWGAVGALRHVDGKLILAWGTISQLGLMITLLSVDSPKATFAAIAILVAHAVFKAALFMVVGEVDVRTGTRDVRELDGLWRTMPVATAVAVISAASMAGIAPLMGFPAKEAAVEAALGLEGTVGALTLIAVVGGSTLTVAYSARLIITMFGPALRSPAPAGEPSAHRLPITVATCVLGLASVAGFVASPWVTARVRGAAGLLDAEATVYTLLRWPGLTTAFVLSVVIVVAGLALGAGVATLPTRTGGPGAIGTRLVDQILDDVLVTARKVTAVVQHGSLPLYLMTVALAAAAATVPFAMAIDGDALIPWNIGAEVPLAALIGLGALGPVFIRDRLGAALGLGIAGFGMVGLFVSLGAPDLAITQLLVETVVVVGFVVGLSHLRQRFPSTGQIWRPVRVAVAGLLGIGVSLALAGATSRPTGTPPVDDLTRRAVDDGGGNNVVNVILTDLRALDTFGEVIVLVAVAVGILALAQASRHRGDDRNVEGRADVGAPPALPPVGAAHPERDPVGAGR